MTEDQSKRIRELEQRISQWESVHEHEVQQERNDQRKLRDTLALSLRVVAIGSIPSVIWVLCWAGIRTAIDSTFSQVFFALICLAAYAVVAAGAARGSGLIAHWWFYRSSVRQRNATVAIALSADALLFWWVITLARW